MQAISWTTVPIFLTDIFIYFIFVCAIVHLTIYVFCFTYPRFKEQSCDEVLNIFVILLPDRASTKTKEDRKLMLQRPLTFTLLLYMHMLFKNNSKVCKMHCKMCQDIIFFHMLKLTSCFHQYISYIYKKKNKCHINKSLLVFKIHLPELSK